MENIKIGNFLKSRMVDEFIEISNEVKGKDIKPATYFVFDIFVEDKETKFTITNIRTDSTIICNYEFLQDVFQIK